MRVAEREGATFHFIKWALAGLIGNMLLVPAVLLLSKFVGIPRGVVDIFAWIGPAIIIFAFVLLQNKVAAWITLAANLYWNVWYLLGLVCFLYETCL